MLQAYVRFVMEVENIPRHISEMLLFHWTMQVPQMLVEYRSRNKMLASATGAKWGKGGQ
jgi:hypothetical protein